MGIFKFANTNDNNDNNNYDSYWRASILLAENGTRVQIFLCTSKNLSVFLSQL